VDDGQADDTVLQETARKLPAIPATLTLQSTQNHTFVTIPSTFRKKIHSITPHLAITFTHSRPSPTTPPFLTVSNALSQAETNSIPQEPFYGRKQWDTFQTVFA
jgi:hypothetical protein